MQTPAKLLRSMAVVSVLGLPLSLGALAQSADISPTTLAAAVVIPQQVRYSGAMVNRAGETVEAVFKIYAGAEGGEALWTETQRVAVGADGSYSVLLGAASQSGLPQAVFAEGQARWVGVTIDRAEGARLPLSSVAYAMKAGDAESVGGLLAANLVTKDDLAKLTQATAAGQVQPLVQAQPADSPTGSGMADYVALWTAAGNLGDSNIFQASSGFLGIGTTTPGGPLELATGATGGANATMMLEQTSAASGNYYADIGLYNTHGLIGNLSALGAGYPAGNIYGANDVVFLGGQQNATTNVLLLTNTGGALKFGTGGYAKTDERMRIGKTGGISIGNGYVATDPGAGNMIVSGNVGIGTTTPAAVLEVNGAAKFDGLVSFAAGQTYPGSATGTITGITTSSPLTGSGTTGMVALGLNASALETTLNGVYAQLGAADTFTSAATFTTAATFSGGLIADQSQGSGYSAVTGQGTSGSIGVYGTSDTGYGVAGASNSGTGVYGASTSGSAAVFSNGSPSAAAVYISNSGDVGSGGFVLEPEALNVQATGKDSVGANVSGTAYGLLGSASDMGGIAISGQTTDGVGGLFINDGTDYAALKAVNAAAGTSSASPIAVQASVAGINAYGVYSVATGNGAFGMYGESDGTTESGSGRSGIGVKGLGTGADSNGLTGDANGTGGYGLYAHASGGPDTKRYASAGVYALANTGIGVEGFAGGQSGVFNTSQSGVSGHPLTAGIWGDTSESASADTDTVAGLVGTADNNYAGYFVNNSLDSSTIAAVNDNSGGSKGLFKVFRASTPLGTCGIGDGDLSCTGQLKTLASTGGGARTVETYATQSAENWMEDYGNGAMQGGVGVVEIEPTFADTVTADMSYHVFLTPLGDSKGHLYVVKTSATRFEVRESGGGTSSIGFDYKIVAKRRGYEAERLVDVTDRFTAEQAETKRRIPARTAVASKGVEEPAMVEHPSLAPVVSRAQPKVRSVAPQAPVVLKRPVASPVVPK